MKLNNILKVTIGNAANNITAITRVLSNYNLQSKFSSSGSALNTDNKNIDISLVSLIVDMSNKIDEASHEMIVGYEKPSNVISMVKDLHDSLEILSELMGIQHTESDTESAEFSMFSQCVHRALNMLRTFERLCEHIDCIDEWRK